MKCTPDGSIPKTAGLRHSPRGAVFCHGDALCVSMIPMLIINGEEIDNLVLTGMPGAGKSTVGVLLAKRLCMEFIDTDLVLQCQMCMPLHALIEKHGLRGFLAIEEKAVATVDAAGAVIATGGSVVYSACAMRHLSERGLIVFLDTPLAVLEPRLADMGERGVAITEGQTLAGLYGARKPLYQRWARITVDCGKMTPSEVAEEILQRLGLW